MRLYLLFALALLLFIPSCIFHKKVGNHALEVKRQMGEFEEIEALWLIWPQTDHKNGESVQDVTLQIIDALYKDLQIVISCADQDIYATAKNILEKRYPTSDNVQLRIVPSVEIWTRDMGPVFVEMTDGTHAIADFNFDSWGYADTLDPYSQIEESFDEEVAKSLGLSLISSTMISEGGNRELNGKGTLITTEVVEKGRNPHMTSKEMEAEYRRLLGVDKVIWLQQGLMEDRHTFLGPLKVEHESAYTVVTTNGHVDEFARFVNDSTILLADIDSADMHDPIARENDRRLEENYRILAESTDQDGNPFHIIRLPLPPSIFSSLSPGDYVYDYIKELEYRDGSVFPDGEAVKVIIPASYLNFIITNRTIVGQKYWRKGMPEVIKSRDEGARNILQKVFPDKKIIMVDALAVNLGGGGLHCISMHQPKIKKN